MKDPVAMYPLKYRSKDASRCDNVDAELFNNDNELSSWPNGEVFFRRSQINTIRITNNNGTWKFKTMTMLLQFRPSTLDKRPIVQFAAHGMSVLLLSLQENHLHFSIYSKCDNKIISRELIQKFAEEDQVERKWHSVAVTYSHATGNVTLHSGQWLYNGYLGNMEIEPQYIYLGNNMKNMAGAGNRNGQYSEKGFAGKLKCFMLYRRILNVSEMEEAERVCNNLANNKSKLT